VDSLLFFGVLNPALPMSIGLGFGVIESCRCRFSAHTTVIHTAIHSAAMTAALRGRHSRHRNTYD
jgi:hypothetical protein